MLQGPRTSFKKNDKLFLSSLNYGSDLKNKPNPLNALLHVCQASTLEAEAGGLQV